VEWARGRAVPGATLVNLPLPSLPVAQAARTHEEIVHYVGTVDRPAVLNRKVVQLHAGTPRSVHAELEMTRPHKCLQRKVLRAPSAIGCVRLGKISELLPPTPDVNF